MDFAEFRDKNEKFIPAYRVICKKYGVELLDVVSDKRTPMFVRARSECWVHLRNQGFSFPEIGKMWDRDHTTVLSATRLYEPKPQWRGGLLPSPGQQAVEHSNQRIAALEARIEALEQIIKKGIG